ncbi:MAG: L-2-amino-thiazoline-4-carboxylic acid hydrolase [Bacteroidales bacterium]|jgi:hypothetical protein
MASNTKSQRRNAFSKTILKNLDQSLASAYCNEKATLIFEKASSILNIELNNMDDRGNKSVRKHITYFILPGFACYKALIESGENSEKSYDFVCNEIHKSFAITGNLMGKFKNFPFAYRIIKLFLGPIMKYAFPKEGWIVVWKENSSKRISFDMTSCLYYEELKKRDALKLCPIFCESDHVAYDPLSPKIVFKRTGTIVQGNKICDFCFEKEN